MTGRPPIAPLVPVPQRRERPPAFYWSTTVLVLGVVAIVSGAWAYVETSEERMAGEIAEAFVKNPCGVYLFRGIAEAGYDGTAAYADCLNRTKEAGVA